MNFFRNIVELIKNQSEAKKNIAELEKTYFYPKNKNSKILAKAPNNPARLIDKKLRQDV